MTVLNTVEDGYRWMDQKVALRAAAAVDRGELLESGIYMQAQAIAVERSLQFFVGRLVSETGEDEKDPKLPFNTHSLRLEGCTGRSAGRNVRLFVNECPEYLLYSGQILGAVGRLMGSEFHAEQLVLPEKFQRTINPTSKMCIVTACGPFSPENMLLFDAISELEVKVRTDSPDVLILMGPLLDVNHPLVASGTLCDAFGKAVTFDEIYREEIFPKIARLARACDVAKTAFYLVPALNEARFDFPLPQPPLNTSPLFASIAPCIQYTSNPATINVGEYTVLVSSTDALASLNANVLFKQAPEGLGRVDACLGELLNSKTLFPLSPSGLRINPALAHSLTITTPPDLVVFPSSGRRFVKHVQGAAFVNPGCMGDGATLATIVMDPHAGISAEITKLA